MICHQEMLHKNTQKKRKYIPIPSTLVARASRLSDSCLLVPLTMEIHWMCCRKVHNYSGQSKKALCAPTWRPQPGPCQGSRGPPGASGRCLLPAQTPTSSLLPTNQEAWPKTGPLTHSINNRGDLYVFVKYSMWVFKLFFLM